MRFGTPSLSVDAGIMRLGIGVTLILAIAPDKKPKVHFDAIASFKVMHSTARCRCGALRPRHDLYPAEEQTAALEAIASFRDKKAGGLVLALYDMIFGQR